MARSQTELDDIINDFVLKYGDIFNIVRLRKNIGLGDALGVGLNHCKNEFVARMDTDDISLPTRIEKQLDVFLVNPEVSFVSSSVSEFYGDDVTNIKSVKTLPSTQKEILIYAKRRNPINHPSVVFKKSAVLAVGGYKHFPLFEDYYLWVRLLQNGFIAANISEPLVNMRSGENLIARRGGLNYLKKVRAFRKFLLKSKFCSFSDYFITMTGQTIVCLIPNKLRGYIYKKMLRK